MAAKKGLWGFGSLGLAAFSVAAAVAMTRPQVTPQVSPVQTPVVVAVTATQETMLPAPPVSKVAVFDLASGRLTLPNGQTVKAGSGEGIARNNPDKEKLKNEGPIPQGLWSVGPVEPHGYILSNGKTDITPSMQLTPISRKQTFGRDRFFWHHSHVQTLSGDMRLQSHGCIVMDDETMKQVIAARKAGIFDRVLVQSKRDSGSRIPSRRTKSDLQAGAVAAIINNG